MGLMGLPTRQLSVEIQGKCCVLLRIVAASAISFQIVHTYFFHLVTTKVGTIVLVLNFLTRL